MHPFCAIILASDECADMQSTRSRYLHTLCGRSVIRWVESALTAAGAADQIYVIGHGQQSVRSELGEDKVYIFQEPDMGSGNACLLATSFLENRSGYTLIARGSYPLLTAETLQRLTETYERANRERPCAGAVLITDRQTDVDIRAGRCIRVGENGAVAAFSRPMSADPSQPFAVNQTAGAGWFASVGVCCFDNARLLAGIGRSIGQRLAEPSHLLDVLRDMVEHGEYLAACEADPSEVVCIRNRSNLQQAAQLMNRRIVRRHMMNGVTIVERDNVWIDDDVRIGMDTIIHAPCEITDGTAIGSGVEIGPGCQLSACQIGRDTRLNASVLDNCVVGDRVQIGPFSRIGDQSVLLNQVTVDGGACIEHAIIGKHTRIGHGSVLRHIQMGEHCQVGAGVVTGPDSGTDANTGMMTVGANCRIGSHATLKGMIAIDSNVCIAAGALVDTPLPEFSMAKGVDEPEIILDWGRR